MTKKRKKQIKAINEKEKEREITNILEKYKKYGRIIFAAQKKNSKAFEDYIKALEEGTVQDAQDKEKIWKDSEKTVDALKEQRKELVNGARWKYPELKNLRAE